MGRGKEEKGGERREEGRGIDGGGEGRGEPGRHNDAYL